MKSLGRYPSELHCTIESSRRLLNFAAVDTARRSMMMVANLQSINLCRRNKAEGEFGFGCFG